MIIILYTIQFGNDRSNDLLMDLTINIINVIINIRVSMNDVTEQQQQITRLYIAIKPPFDWTITFL